MTKLEFENTFHKAGKSLLLHWNTSSVCRGMLLRPTLPFSLPPEHQPTRQTTLISDNSADPTTKLALQNCAIFISTGPAALPVFEASRLC